MTNPPLDKRDRRVLSDIGRIAGNTPLLIVGAGARLLSFDIPLGISHGRSTTDWDIAVQLDHALIRSRVVLLAPGR